MSPRLTPPFVSLALAGACMCAAGCGGGAGDGRVLADAGSQALGRLEVVVSVPRDGEPQVSASARLLRYRNLDAQTAEILAGAPDPGEGALGSCVVVDGEARLDDALATTSPDAAVQLLDAGEMVVRVAGVTLPLGPRYLPEILPFVSGVVYQAEAGADLPDGLRPELSERDEVSVAAFGGEDVGPFVAHADVPEPVRITAVNGADPSDGVSALGVADVVVAWAKDGRPGEPVSVSLAAAHGVELRCRVADTGRAVLPGHDVRRVAAAATDGLTLAVERSARAGFRARGLDGGEVVVTVRNAVPVRAR